MPYAWVFGLKEGNTIKVPCKQYLGQLKTMSGTYGMFLFAGTDYAANESNPVAFDYTPQDALYLNIEGDDISLPQGSVIIWSASKTTGQPYNGAVKFKIQPFNEEPIVPSKEAEHKIYTISYVSSKNKGEETSYLTDVAFSGDSVFIQKASYYMKNMTSSWIYGIKKGDKVIFPSGQYIGDYVGTGDFPTYLYGAEITGTDENGDNTYKLKEEFVMRIEGDNFVSDETYALKLGGIITEDCNSLKLKPYTISPAIPKPVTYISFLSSPSPGSFNFYYPVEDENGEILVTDSLYFRMYLDGKPYTFVPKSEGGQYEELTQTMTEVPVTSTDGHDLFASLLQNRCQVYVYDDYESVGFEMVYRIGNYVGTSARAIWTKADGFTGTEGEGSLTTGISGIKQDNNLLRTDTYNVYGQPINEDKEGIVIRVNRYKDGTVKVSKTLNR